MASRFVLTLTSVKGSQVETEKNAMRTSGIMRRHLAPKIDCEEKLSLRGGRHC